MPDHPGRAVRFSATEPERRAARRAGVAVFVVFVLAGFAFANWAARLPAVRTALDLSPQQMGLLLLVASLGSLIALPLVGLIVERFGARAAVRVFVVVNGVGLALAALGVSAGWLALVVPALLVFGVGIGVWDAAMNIAGAAVEQRLHTSVMPRFHAGFSLGTMAGAGAGAVAAGLGISVALHLTGVAVLNVVVVLGATRWFLAQDPPEADPGRAAQARARALAAWREPRTLLIGLVVLAAALTEGAANDWVALAVVDGFGTTEATGAIVFGVFVTAMTATRMLGTGLLDRYGRVPLLAACTGCALLGLALFALAPNLPLAVVGAAAWGLGAALGFPVGMSAASDDPTRSAVRVSVVSTIGYGAFLAGPPLLGLLAEHVGYRHALLAIAVPVLAALLALPAVRPPTPAPSPGTGSRSDHT